MSEREEMEEALALARDVTRTQRMEEARLRLACAALTGILAGDQPQAIPHNTVVQWSVGLADEMLALLYPEAPKGEWR